MGSLRPFKSAELLESTRSLDVALFLRFGVVARFSSPALLLDGDADRRFLDLLGVGGFSPCPGCNQNHSKTVILSCFISE